MYNVQVSQRTHIGGCLHTDRWRWLNGRLLVVIPFIGFIITTFSGTAEAQIERPHIDVSYYDITADIDLSTKTLKARASVHFVPHEKTNRVIFELHNALNVSRVENDKGFEISAIRYGQNFTLQLSFPEALQPEETTKVTFFYEGQLDGTSDSPVEGYDLATIEATRAYLLYPARWFPVNGYNQDRFAANIQVTVDPELRVIASGLSTTEKKEAKVTHSFEFSRESFPGSIAVVSSDEASIKSNGTTTKLYFSSVNQKKSQLYGEAVGAIVQFFTDRFLAPYSTSLTLVEIGDLAPAGYVAPGIIFLSSHALTKEINWQLLGSTVARQWWGVLTSPGNRNHSWLSDGMALYSAMLFVEERDGVTGFDPMVETIRINALTYNDIPLIQSGRLGEFSQEVNALAGYKGAMILHMMRWMLGDEVFSRTLANFIRNYAWKTMSTNDFRDTAEAVSGKDLEPFFIQWTESRETPEFSQEYTVYRLGEGEGFRIIGKIRQDMDTFRMPVELKVETEGEPEYETVDVFGASSDYIIDTFGKPQRVILDPKNRLLRFDENIRVRVEIRKGEQLVELGYYNEALINYQKALEVNKYSSLAHYRIGEVFLLQNNYQSAANEFRESLNGDQSMEWTLVWSHINLGKIFDITGQRERAVNEYQLAVRTRDNTQGAQDEARKYLEKPYRRKRLDEERLY